jgi:hypothetical protein
MGRVTSRPAGTAGISRPATVLLPTDTSKGIELLSAPDNGLIACDEKDGPERDGTGTSEKGRLMLVVLGT